MHSTEIRWQQRFSNYEKALAKLHDAVSKIKLAYGINQSNEISKDHFLDDIIKEGIIQRFEYTHELAWNVMKDFLNEAGNNAIFGSKDATREAFALGLIEEGECWMDMITSRNKSSHTYNEETADEIFLKIMYDYHRNLLRFQQIMAARINY